MPISTVCMLRCNLQADRIARNHHKPLLCGKKKNQKSVPGSIIIGWQHVEKLACSPLQQASDCDAGQDGSARLRTIEGISSRIPCDFKKGYHILPKTHPAPAPLMTESQQANDWPLLQVDGGLSFGRGAGAERMGVTMPRERAAKNVAGCILIIEGISSVRRGL